MPILAFATQHGTLLDILALVCSLVLLLFLAVNRRRYGAMVLGVGHDKPSASFTDEVTRQLISQQSQKAYDNLQLSLAREFETFRRMGNGDWRLENSPPEAPQGLSLAKGPVRSGGQERRRRYRRAGEMIAQGADRDTVMRQCGLAGRELELLQGLQQLEQGHHA